MGRIVKKGVHEKYHEQLNSQQRMIAIYLLGLVLIYKSNRGEIFNRKINTDVNPNSQILVLALPRGSSDGKRQSVWMEKHLANYFDDFLYFYYRGIRIRK